MVYKLRMKYKKNLVDPTGGKEPLAYQEYMSSNQDTLKKNSKYKAAYRIKKKYEVKGRVQDEGRKDLRVTQQIVNYFMKGNHYLTNVREVY